jgi:hypothetical protein
MQRFLVLSTVILCLSGCDTDSTDDPQERITAAAYSRACSEARDLLESQYSGSYFVQALCTAAAVENNTDAVECGMDLDECINNPPASIQSGIDAILSQGGCSLIDINTSTCSSTLGQIQDCLSAIDAEISSLQYTLTCAAAGQTLDNWDVVEVPSACQFETDC